MRRNVARQESLRAPSSFSLTILGDVRGVGLFIGIDLVRNRETREPAPEEAQHVVARMKEELVLLSADGPFRNVLKIKPPLVFSQADADHVTSLLDQILTEIKDLEVLDSVKSILSLIRPT